MAFTGKFVYIYIYICIPIVGLYPSIPHYAGLQALYEMAEFILKNNFFEFETKIIQQISRTAIGTTFAPPYKCLFMDRIENDFLDSKIVKPWLYLRYIDDIFFIWTEGQDKLERFLDRLNNLHPNLEFTHEKSKSSVNFFDVSVDNKLETDLFCKPTDGHQFRFSILLLPIHFNCLQPGTVYQKTLLISISFPPLKPENLVLEQRIPTESCRCPN